MVQTTPAPSRPSKKWLWLLGAAAALAACGGGGDDNPPAPPTPQPVDRIEPYDTAAAPATRAARALAWRRMAPAQAQTALRRVVLPPLGAADAAAQPRSARAGAIPGLRAGAGAAVQIGVARALADTADAARFAAQLHWVQAADGARVAAVSFASPGAQGVRLGVQVHGLPALAVLRFYAQDGSGIEPVVQLAADEVGALVARNLLSPSPGEDAYTVWSPDFGGAETTLEIELPPQADVSALQISVPRLSHLHISPEAALQYPQPRDGLVGAAGRCTPDVLCRSEYEPQSRAVARMGFVSLGASYLCTGTLLNDARSSGAPYLLSARHCIANQAEASSLVTDWFFHASACGNATPSPATRRLAGGATLLHAGAATDVALLRLREPPPPGVVYAGSYFGAPPAQGSAVAGLHHPGGDLQKISQGSIAAQSQCTNFVCQASNADEGDHFTVQWSEGVTEMGSSGSPLFLPLGRTRYVVGQLSSGASSCVWPAGPDHYGRFDRAYRGALHQWLNPS